MLQRIYGTAFKTKEELNTYLNRLEEAKKRDHRVLGKELDLFSCLDEIGGGLVLWHPKGAMVRHIIEDFWKKEHIKKGYQLLYTPHIGKAHLWDTSGHLEFYAENMYSPIQVEEQQFFIKPMNCPFHVMIYKNKPHSYRDLPVRFAELGTVYRFERSGVLHGLLRVRGFTQDDAHIICEPDQIGNEITNVLTFCMFVLKTFGFDKIKICLSTRPKDKFVGEEQKWTLAESALKLALETCEFPFEIDEGGGAFYGPKIDIKIEDAIGREWQCSTIQFDFNLPERFDMTYIGQDGKKHRPFMIHRAIFGSLERFFGVLIEHYEGKFPFWLAPVQIKILSVIEDVSGYCAELKTNLESEGIRVETDLSSEKIGYKIRLAALEKVPYIFVIGQKEKQGVQISVRERGKGDLGSMRLEHFFKMIKSN